MKTHVTRATVNNIAFAIVCAVVALSQETEFVSVIPAKYKHYVTLVAFFAVWLKSHWNYFVDPQGNPVPPPPIEQVNIPNPNK